MNENLYQIVLLESSRRRFLFDELLLNSESDPKPLTTVERCSMSPAVRPTDRLTRE